MNNITNLYNNIDNKAKHIKKLNYPHNNDEKYRYLSIKIVKIVKNISMNHKQYAFKN